MKILLLVCACLLIACQKSEKIEKQFSDKMLIKIEDDVKRDDITGRIHLLFRSVDSQNWTEVKEVLSNEIEFDMGEGTSKKTSDEVIEIWKKATAGLDGILHTVGNYGIEVNGREARVMFVGVATHFKKTKSGRNTRTYHGSYELHMLQPEGDPTNWAWKITKFKYKNKFIDGNLKL